MAAVEEDHDDAEMAVLSQQLHLMSAERRPVTHSLLLKPLDFQAGAILPPKVKTQLSYRPLPRAGGNFEAKREIENKADFVTITAANDARVETKVKLLVEEENALIAEFVQETGQPPFEPDSDNDEDGESDEEEDEDEGEGEEEDSDIIEQPFVIDSASVSAVSASA